MTEQKQMNSIPAMSGEGLKRLVLIVEDEFVNRELLNAYLEQDYEILCAETGVEAMRLIYEKSETLSLVLLDLNLPGMNGLDILREIKKDIDLSRIPVIVLTSDAESEVESLSSGASDFIPKPYPRYEIIQARVRRSIELSENRDLIRWTERDHLTGLYNREYFYRYAEQYDVFHRDEATDALVVDVSHFRLINERFGKAYADEILKRIGSELLAIVKETGGIVCRREADTFQVYCPHMADYRSVAERVTDAACGDARGRVRIRIGVCSEVDKASDIERHFDHAKSAADTIRNSFTESVAIYNDELRDKEVYAERLLEDFRDALEQKQFLVYYQPKYHILSPQPRLCGAEALVRWKHPEFGLVSPGRFIPLFESNGLIRDLDNYVWRETAAQIRRWKDHPGRAVPVSVNVSRVDMLDPELTDTLRLIVEENGLDFGDLHLETTESAYTENFEQIIQTVARLRALGFKIEMDDFGSGYSSLNMITKLPFDVLKLDMEFIRTAFSENGNTGILKIMLDIADYLSVPMIAEGVETESQMLTLKELGCDIAQGYYFARPMPADAFGSLLAGSAD
ncbi:MAG: EAL domain-containing protein [Oscillospiraceae bacterium]|nr:EAL domain-containing protein [Oscillospiraceae bacterium]